MRNLSRAIGKQLEHAVHACYTPGDSKRADKFNAAIDTSWKIYSISSRRDMLDLAKDFGKFVKEEYPEVNRAYLITSDVLQAYVDKKAATCVDATLDKIISRLGKLERCCEHTYENSVFTWEVVDVQKPVSTKNADFVKDTPVPLEVSKKVIEALSQRKTEVYRAVILSTYCGMRAEETTGLKAGNVHFTGGEFSYGWVEIVKGGGAKGDRPRIIPIISQEAQRALKTAVAGKKSDEYVAAKDGGGKMTADNVQRTLREWMDKEYGRTYKGNRCHGMRKTWAQMYYDTIRKKGCSQKQAVEKTNVVLGHGSKRGVEMVRMYVKNIW